MTGRTRPSGVGSNSQRFAEVRMPNGQPFRVPQAKDAATLICMAEEGDWPAKRRAMAVLLYDVTWLLDGMVFECEEMRPGHGMGDTTAVRVIQSRARLQIHEGNYGQMQRWVLVERVMGLDETDDASADDLLAGN